MKINELVTGTFFKPVKGIYKITNTATGRVYIGQSRTVQSRLSSHFAELEGGRHASPAMQNDWSQHGPDSFEVEVLEYVEGRVNRLIREAEILAEAIAAGEVYNTSISVAETLKSNIEARKARLEAREKAAAEKHRVLSLKKAARVNEHGTTEAGSHRSGRSAVKRKNDIFGSGEFSGHKSSTSLERLEQRLRLSEADLRAGEEGFSGTAEPERPQTSGVDENGQFGDGYGDVQETLPDDDYYQENLTGEYLGFTGVTKEQWEDDIQLFKEAIEEDSVIDGALAWFLRTYIRHDILFEAVEDIDRPLIFIDLEKGPEYAAEIIREYIPGWELVLKALEDSAG